jgi:hypothetical protein
MVSRPAILPGLPCLRSIASNGSCRAGFGFRRYAQQAHQTLDVRGGTGHQLLHQDLRMAAAARSTTTVAIHDFSQFPFQLGRLLLFITKAMLRRFTCWTRHLASFGILDEGIGRKQFGRRRVGNRHIRVHIQPLGIFQFPQDRAVKHPARSFLSITVGLHE